MGSNRRTFLQQAGLALLTLGVSKTGLSFWDERSWVVPWAKRYYQTLAQPTNRKLALLVGINQYSDSPDLRGCVTDVELQRELLIHRFGFHPQDVLTLTGNQATREDIETAFIEHLSEQAVAGDVVVFHFSGYGSQVKVPQPLSGNQLKASDTQQPDYRLVNSLVPIDGILPTKGMPARNDLLEETLVLLARSLATEKLTVILDTSHESTGKVLQGNLRVRSFSRISERPSPEELAFQQKLQNRIYGRSKAMSLGQSGKLARSRSPQPGIILSAAGKSQIAGEAQWEGFSAGLFTYALTQYLWQVTPASKVLVSLARTAETVQRFTGKQQQPQLTGGGKQPLFTYYLLPDRPTGAEGIVTAVEDSETVRIRLTGLPVTILEYYGINSRLSLVSQPEVSTSEKAGAGETLTAEAKPNQGSQGAERRSEPVLQIRSREGLTAKARLVGLTSSDLSPLKVGQPVQELIRVFPRNLGLTVALDASLERIERVDATSAFSGISAVSSVAAAGEQAADCLFGRVVEAEREVVDPNLNLETSRPQESRDSPTLPGGYGLFSVGGVPIPETVGADTEAVKSAVKRLVPQLKTLLAAKLWRLTVNEGSSRLGVRATLETMGAKPQKSIRRETWRQSEDSGRRSLGFNFVDDTQMPLPDNLGLLPTLSIGSQIQYRLENYSDRPVYLMLLGIDSGGNAIALYSPQLKSESERNGSQSKLKNQLIAPGKTLIVPQPSASSNWVVSEPEGLAEIQIICSCAPFRKTLKALSASQHLKGNKEQVLDLLNPLEVAQALLQDLHDASAVPEEITGSTSDVYALDVNAWVTLSFVYQVA